jgi:hypothetical protein
MDKEAKAKLLADFFRHAAGLGPGQKFLANPVKNAWKVFTKPQIAGLDRPIAAGAVRRPAKWNFLSSSRPPVTPRGEPYSKFANPPWKGRRWDMPRQALAHAIRGTGRASVIASGLGGLVGVYKGVPTQVADTLARGFNVRQTPEERAELAAKLRRPLAGLLWPGGDTSPMSQYHDEVARKVAVPWAREQIHWAQRHDPYGVAARYARYLNPAGIAINTGLIPLIERETKPGELEGIAEKTLAKHLPNLTDPRRSAENMASPWADIYRQTPPEWFNRDLKRTRDWAGSGRLSVGGSARGVTPLAHAAVNAAWDASKERELAKADVSSRAALWLARQATQGKVPESIASTLAAFDKQLAESKKELRRQHWDAMRRHVIPKVEAAGDMASRGIQEALQKGRGFLEENPQALPTVESGLYLYLKGKGYNPPMPRQAVARVVSSKLKMLENAQSQPGLSTQQQLDIAAEIQRLRERKRMIDAQQGIVRPRIPG